MGDGNALGEYLQARRALVTPILIKCDRHPSQQVLEALARVLQLDARLGEHSGRLVCVLADDEHLWM